MTYRGKVRLYVFHTGKRDSYAEPEVLESEYFDDGILSDVDVAKGSILGVLSHEIHSMGWYLWRGSIDEILAKYQEGDTVEIVADAHVEYSQSWTDCGYEYDAQGWFQNEMHRKLTPEQVKYFCPEENESCAASPEKKEPTS